MNVSFQLVTADLVLQRSAAHALSVDFQILTQIARADRGESSSLSRRAFHATNEIMNMFQRVEGDENGQINEVLRRCSEISWEVLGPLDSEGIQKLCTHDPDCQPEAKIWGIGHW
jgi:hypothetical protein